MIDDKWNRSIVEKLLSRRLALVVAFTVATIAGLYYGKLSGSEFITSEGIILGLYKLADFLDKSKWTS